MSSNALYSQKALARFNLIWKAAIGAVFGVLMFFAFMFVTQIDETVNAAAPNDVSGTCSIEYLDTAQIPLSSFTSDYDEQEGEDAASESDIASDKEGENSKDNVGNTDAPDEGNTPSSTIDEGSDDAEAPSFAAPAEEPDDGSEKATDTNEEQDKQVVSDEGVQMKSTYRVVMPDGTKIIAYGTREGYIPKDGEYSFSGTLREDGSYNVAVNVTYDAKGADDVNAASRAEIEANGPGLTQPIDDFIWTPAKGYIISDLGNIENGNEDSSVPETGEEEPFKGASSDIVTTEEVDVAVPESVRDEVAAAQKDESEAKTVEEAPESLPLTLSATALDAVSQAHEGCADGDVKIEVTLRYENLPTKDEPYAAKVALIDSYNGKAIEVAKDEPAIVDSKLVAKSSYEPGDSEKEALTTEFDFLDKARKLCDMFFALPDEERIDAGDVPAFKDVEDKVAAIKDAPMTDQQVADALIFFDSLNSFYLSLPPEKQQEVGAFPSRDGMEWAERTLNALAIKQGRVTGEEIITVSAPAESVIGKKVAASVTLFDGKEEVVSLPGADEKEQIVSYPLVLTEATVLGYHDAAAVPGTVVIDTISYVGLEAGAKYHVETYLMDKATQTNVVDGKNGETVYQVTEFVPQSSSGTMNVMTSAFDASTMMNRQAVVYERMYRCVELTDAVDGDRAVNASDNNNLGGIHSSQKGTLVAVHENIKDELQTINFSKEEWAEDEIEPGASLSAMGDETSQPYIAALAIVAALVVIGIVKVRRKMKE